MQGRRGVELCRRSMDGWDLGANVVNIHERCDGGSPSGGGYVSEGPQACSSLVEDWLRCAGSRARRRRPGSMARSGAQGLWAVEVWGGDAHHRWAAVGVSR